MKNYHVKNYILYKNDLKESMPDTKPWDEYTRDELIVKFLPLVENIARSFSTDDKASGISNICDMIQEGSIGLIRAVDKIDIEFSISKIDTEKSIKSFLSKRIKGAIRRAVDINRGSMRIPEHRLIEIRSDNGNTEKVAMFFNSIFKSIDEYDYNENNPYYNIPDLNKEYRVEMLNSLLINIINKNLKQKEAFILKASYGLEGRKMSANDIAKEININGNSAHIRVSQLKRQAIDKLIHFVNISQVIDFL
jgi:RNA polymerase sigma factor (sigma-70 family)